jgi:hypothetical protein
MYELDIKKVSIENYIDQLPYDVARPLLDCTAFEKNSGYKTSKNILVRKYCELHPEQTFAIMLNTLRQIPDLPLLIAYHSQPGIFIQNNCMIMQLPIMFLAIV